MAPGQRARVTHYGAAGDTLQGRVTQVSPVLDAGSRTFKAALAIDNGDGLLRAGHVRQDRAGGGLAGLGPW